MKSLLKNNLTIACVILSFLQGFAQDSTKKELNLNTRFFSENNKLMYVTVNTRWRGEKGFQPVGNSRVFLYLDAESDSSLIGKLTTDDNGFGKQYFPPFLKNTWDSASQHTIIAVAEGNESFEEGRSELTIRKSKISIDTSSTDEGKTITVTVLSHDGSEWVPAKDVEMRIGVRRLSGGLLSAGTEETYTTDSTGSVTMDFRKDTIPGNTKGNLILAAKVEDNEELGNLVIEKTVNWGQPTSVSNNFFEQRTLWSTRTRTPPWLLVMAYSIVIAVWSTIFYLIYQIIKIKKLGAH